MICFPKRVLWVIQGKQSSGSSKCVSIQTAYCLFLTADCFLPLHSFVALPHLSALSRLSRLRPLNPIRHWDPVRISSDISDIRAYERIYEKCYGRDLKSAHRLISLSLHLRQPILRRIYSASILASSNGQKGNVQAFDSCSGEGPQGYNKALISSCI